MAGARVAVAAVIEDPNFDFTVYDFLSISE
jgi:hypothetical protein